MPSIRVLLSSLVLALVLPLRAVAVNGVLEINQTCAVSTGCFSGDVAGFPVAITTGGSYRLTGNLATVDLSDDAIEIFASHVSIDLNGFEIVGPTTCTGSPAASCGPAGTSDGIGVNGASIVGVAVINGTVRGMPGSGVRAGKDSQVERVRALGNGITGISVNTNSHVKDCLVKGNGGRGIAINTTFGDPNSSLALVQDNVVAGNGGDGIRLDNSAAQITGNTVNDNGGDGIRLGTSSAGSNLVNNTIAENGGNGITASFDSSLQGNVVTANTGVGLAMSTRTVYGDNVVNDNVGGEITFGIDRGGNVCNGTAGCP